MIDTPSTEFRITRRTIVTNIATLFSGSAIAQAITAVTFILTARQLGPEQYGQYTGSMVFATFCSIVFSLGLDIWLLREGGRIPTRIGNLVSSVLVIKVTIGLVWLGAMYILALWINSSSLPVELVRLAALIIWLDSMFMTALTGFKAILRNKINSLLQVASALIILSVVILLISRGETQASVFMQARAVILSFSLLVSLIFVWYFLKIKPSRSTAKTALTETPPYAVSEFLAWTYMRVDVLIIAFILNEYAVGLYAPAEGIINALYIVPLAVYFVMVPVLSNLFLTDRSQAWLTAKRFIGVLGGIGIALFVALYFGAKFIVYLLGPAYAGSEDILQILSVILLIHSIIFGAAAILVATNQQVKRSLVQAVAVGLNIGLTLLVIQHWGITGVAYAYVVTEIFLLLGYTFLVLRYRHQNPIEAPKSAMK
jgi:O-antigen/teichoic acid export membrane protein